MDLEGTGPYSSCPSGCFPWSSLQRVLFLPAGRYQRRTFNGMLWTPGSHQAALDNHSQYNLKLWGLSPWESLSGRMRRHGKLFDESCFISCSFYSRSKVEVHREGRCKKISAEPRKMRLASHFHPSTQAETILLSRCIVCSLTWDIEWEKAGCGVPTRCPTYAMYRRPLVGPQI